MHGDGSIGHMYLFVHICYFSVLILLATDTMCMGVWSELAKLQNPELQRLAQLLTKSVFSRRADSTVSKYGNAFQRWKSWSESHKEVTVFPVSEVYFTCTYST